MLLPFTYVLGHQTDKHGSKSSTLRKGIYEVSN